MVVTYPLYQQRLVVYFYFIAEVRRPIPDQETLESLIHPQFQIAPLGQRYDGIPRHVHHFSEEANHAFAHFVVARYRAPEWQTALCDYAAKQTERNAGLQIDWVQFWSSHQLRSLAGIVKVTAIANDLQEALAIIEHGKHFFDQRFAPHERNRMFCEEVCVNIASGVTWEEEIYRNWAKPLSYAVIDATHSLPEPSQIPALIRAGARAKSRVYADDIVHNPILGQNQTYSTSETVFQQWGSTKLAFSPVGSMILSATHNHGEWLRFPTAETGGLSEWVEMRHLPILIVVELQKEYLLRISRDIAKTGTNRHRDLLRFRNYLWPYKITNDFHDERVWIEAKKANDLDHLFQSLLDQTDGHARWTETFILKGLTFLEAAVGVGEIMAAIHGPQNASLLWTGEMASVSVMIASIITWAIHTWAKRQR